MFQANSIYEEQNQNSNHDLQFLKVYISPRTCKVTSNSPEVIDRIKTQKKNIVMSQFAQKMSLESTQLKNLSQNIPKNRKNSIQKENLDEYWHQQKQQNKKVRINSRPQYMDSEVQIVNKASKQASIYEYLNLESHTNVQMSKFGQQSLYIRLEQSTRDQKCPQGGQAQQVSIMNYQEDSNLLSSEKQPFTVTQAFTIHQLKEVKSSPYLKLVNANELKRQSTSQKNPAKSSNQKQMRMNTQQNPYEVIQRQKITDNSTILKKNFSNLPCYESIEAIQSENQSQIRPQLIDHSQYNAQDLSQRLSIEKQRRDQKKPNIFKDIKYRELLEDIQLVKKELIGPNPQISLQKLTPSPFKNFADQKTSRLREPSPSNIKNLMNQNPNSSYSHQVRKLIRKYEQKSLEKQQTQKNNPNPASIYHSGRIKTQILTNRRQYSKDSQRDSSLSKDNMLEQRVYALQEAVYKCSESNKTIRMKGQCHQGYPQPTSIYDANCNHKKSKQSLNHPANDSLSKVDKIKSFDDQNSTTLNANSIYNTPAEYANLLTDIRFLRKQIQSSNSSQKLSNHQISSEIFFPQFEQIPRKWHSDSEVEEIGRKIFTRLLHFKKGRTFPKYFPYNSSVVLQMIRTDDYVHFSAEDDEHLHITFQGKIYFGGWIRQSDGYRDGFGYYYSPGKYVFEGEWLHGKKHGFGVKNFNDGKVCKGQWINNQLVRGPAGCIGDSMNSSKHSCMSKSKRAAA